MTITPLEEFIQNPMSNMYIHCIYDLYINHFHHCEKNIVHPGMHVDVQPVT